MSTANSNGGTTVKVHNVDRGTSVAHRVETKAQRAVRAADIYDGAVVYRPTLRELVAIFDVSAATIQRVRQLSPESRQALAAGDIKLTDIEPKHKRDNADATVARVQHVLDVGDALAEWLAQ